METNRYFVKMNGSFILVTATPDISIESIEKYMLNQYDGSMTEIWNVNDNPTDCRLDHIDKEILIFRDSWHELGMFEVVDDFPGGYVVWNIGRHNFPHESYVPIAMDIGNYRVDNPKCIKVKSEELALSIMYKAAHGKGFIGRLDFNSLCGR